MANVPLTEELVADDLLVLNVEKVGLTDEQFVLRRDRWDALTDEQQEKIPPLCPDFVVELMSPSDRRPVRFRMLQAKMAEYIDNGAQLGWLIDPFKKNVYVHHPNEPVQILEDPTIIHGDPVLPRFTLQVSDIW